MLRVRTVFTGPAGTPWLSTMYFAGTTQTDANNAVVEVGAFWGAVDAGMSSTVSWATEADVAVIDSATGDLTNMFSTTPQTGSGASAGDMLPTAAQCLIRWRTAGVVAGRIVRGRTFVPGVTEAFSASGRPLASYLTTLNAAAAALAAASPHELVIWSRPFEGNPEADPPQPARSGTAHPVSTGSAWTDFAVQRSRRD